MRHAEISVAAIRHNVQTLRRLTGTGVIVVVKADAYGHGAQIVAPAAMSAGAAMVAVASIEEAIALREGGCAAPILCWLHAERLDYAAAVHHGLTLGVSSATQLATLASAASAAGVVAHAHIKLDTGLSRNGAAPEAWEELFAAAARAERSGWLRVTGLFSHLANAGDAADRSQAARFDAGARILRMHGITAPLKHLAASAAALSSPHLAYDSVRVGAAAYDLSPEQNGDARDHGLRPAMTFATEILSLRRAPVPAAVTGTPAPAWPPAARGDALLAQLPVGFGDGMPRALGGTGLTVSVCGERAPLVGEVAMDECVVDVSHLADRVHAGDRVVLFGDPARGEPAVEDWSERLGSINYEIVARLGPRVHRTAVDRGEPPPPPPPPPPPLLPPAA